LLHQQLLQSIRARAALEDGPKRKFYRVLEEVVSPWVSLRTLALEDREILCDLFVRCVHLEHLLKGPPPDVSYRVWATMGLLGLVGAVAVLFWRYVVS